MDKNCLFLLNMKVYVNWIILLDGNKSRGQATKPGRKGDEREQKEKIMEETRQ
jgi:hypothetical protein